MRVLRVLLATSVLAIAVAGGQSGHSLRAQVRRQAVAAMSFADLRSWDATVDRMKRDDSLRVHRTIEDTELSGRLHERLDQYYKGIRVYGGDIARQTDRGLTVSIFGTIYEGIDLDVTPALSIEAVKAVIERESGVSLGPGRTPERVLFPDAGSG